MKPIIATGIALLAALIWGASGVPQKTVLEHLDAFTVTGLTCLLGAIVIFPLARREARQNPTQGRPGVGSTFLVAIPFAVAVTLSQIGYGYTSVTNAGFFVNTAAVITPFIAWALHKRRPRLWIFPASALTVTGLAMMGGSLRTLALGDALCLASAFAFSFWMVLLGDHVTRHGNPNYITYHQLLVCSAGSLLLGLLLHGLPTPAQLLHALPELLIIGILAKGVAFCLNASAQQHVHPAGIAVIVSAEAVFGSLFAVILINESLSLNQAIGAILVTAGIFLVILVQIPGFTAEREAHS